MSTAQTREGSGGGATHGDDSAATPTAAAQIQPTPEPRRRRRLIGDVVVELGFAERERVEDAVAIARDEGKPTGQVLVDEGVLRPDQLARVLAERFDIEYVDLSKHELDLGAVNLLGFDAAKRYQAVPIGFLEDRTLLVAMADPTNVLTLEDISMITGMNVKAAAASQEDIRLLITRLTSTGESIQDIVDEPEQTEQHAGAGAAQEAPIIKLVHSIIGQAIEQGASDVHFDPEEREMRVLYRIDGVLYQTATLPRRMASGVVSRIKIMADLDISERRVPQDGRLALNVDGRRVDLRAVTLPLVGGEGVVLRVLDRGAVIRELDALGMLAEEKERFQRSIARRSGCVLVTGPTGSGKSTTLYAALSEINTGDRSVLTIEDPVESPLAGVKQMQITPKAGVTFATGLRSMLRADPDVIMVGEIRDRETAQIAVEAALTGHLVLSTLHTRDAPGALTRLVDMGIPAFLVSSALECVVAQRLTRTLCTHCKRESNLPESVLAEYDLAGARIYEAVGCVRCANTGYRGRTGIYEVMPVTAEVRGALLEHASTDLLAEIGVAQGMRRLREDGMAKVRDGVTSIAEIGRVVGLG
jgi:type IV pilus assembly protein PilB